MNYDLLRMIIMFSLFKVMPPLIAHCSSMFQRTKPPL